MMQGMYNFCCTRHNGRTVKHIKNERNLYLIRDFKELYFDGDFLGKKTNF